MTASFSFAVKELLSFAVIAATACSAHSSSSCSLFSCGERRIRLDRIPRGVGGEMQEEGEGGDKSRVTSDEWWW